jgi:predicted membrane-bound spermidine synthase
MLPPYRLGSRRVPAPIYFAFFLSGSASVVYQLIWQRVLSGVYGTTIEAVTTVVAAFMAGLGLGSLAGGWLADNSRMSARTLFVIAELAIGLFGWVSVPLFREIGARTVDADPVFIWLIVGGLLLVPTMLMGATLPILTAGVEATTEGHTPIGLAVGRLYAVNTFGAAVGCVATVVVIAGLFGQRGSVASAAILNLTAALLGWMPRRSS